jgi:hypothetical protein
MIYIRGDAMGKATQAARLSVVSALLLGFAGFLTSAASAAPTPRLGEYYGTQNGTVVEFELVKSHGVIKGHYLGRALSFPSSAPPSCFSSEADFLFGNPGVFLFAVRNGRITDLHRPKRHDVFGFSGSFSGQSKASGKFAEAVAGGGCVADWTAEWVSRPTFAKTGTWVGNGDGLGVTFEVSGGGRIASDFKFTIAKPIGKCDGPFGVGGTSFIPPTGSSFSSAFEVEGDGAGFVASFPSATSATGTFKGTGGCQSPAMAWNAQPSG